jgi:surface-anchored protein
MTINTITRGTTRRRRTIVSSVATGLLALALSLATAMPANAGTLGTFSQGHVDTGFVALSPTANKLILGSNVDENPNYTNRYYTTTEVNATSAHVTPQYDFEVKSAAKQGSVWVIPDTLAAADAKGVLFAGFAGAAENKSSGSTLLARSLFTNGVIGTSKHITYKITTDAGSAGTIGLDFSTAQTAGEDVTVSGSPNNYSVKFGFANADDEEAFHVHPKWTFSQSGDYWVKVVASTDASGVSASDPIYYHFHVDA